jgi:hypothetical protein
VCVARAAASQFSTLLFWSGDFAHRHIDDTARDDVEGQIVAFLFGPVGGVWVERLERRKLLVWTQALAAVESLAMAAALILFGLSHALWLSLLLMAFFLALRRSGVCLRGRSRIGSALRTR